MGVLGIDMLKEGMVLADDLKTLEGRVILKAGSSLTAKAIHTCTIWGVNEADVLLPKEEKKPAKKAPETIDIGKQYRQLAIQRFRLADTTHPALRILARRFASTLSKQLSSEQANKYLARYQKQQEQPLATMPISMETILQRDVELVSLPTIFHEITEALRNPRSSAAYVADIISKDIALSAKLLRMVNTPFYGFPGHIDTLSRAVTIVGTNQLTSLALGLSVISAFAEIPEEYINPRDFWLQSVTCGTLARLIAIRSGIDGDERFFVAGLLHGIGLLVLLNSRADMVSTVLEQAHSSGIPMHVLEKKCWGWDHCELGAQLLKHWKLPTFLENQVRYHYEPDKAPQPEQAAVAHVAQVTTHTLFIEENGVPFVPPLNNHAWKSLGISSNDLMDIIKQAQFQAETVMAAFFDG